MYRDGFAGFVTFVRYVERCHNCCPLVGDGSASGRRFPAPTSPPALTPDMPFGGPMANPYCHSTDPKRRGLASSLPSPYFCANHIPFPATPPFFCCTMVLFCVSGSCGIFSTTVVSAEASSATRAVSSARCCRDRSGPETLSAFASPATLGLRRCRRCWPVGALGVRHVR